VRPLALALLLPALCAAAEPRVTVATRGAAPGESALIVVEGEAKGARPAGTLGGETLRFWHGKRGAWLAFAGFDLDASTGPRRLELELSGDGGKPHYWSGQVIVEPKAYPTQEVTVDQKYVTPPKADEERAEKEARLLARLYAERTPKRLFKGAFVSPIPGALSSRFGERRIFNGVPKSPHGGADLRAKQGVPVKAAAGGRVVLTEDLFYSGNTVILDHGLGLYTIYCHLSRIDVKHGQLVSRGARLGLVGATGRVSGPHLHWAAKLQGARVDPFSLVDLPLAKY
jgi:murein DD-endopeptidase MepM/ murein hydrolase activator NlpD